MAKPGKAIQVLARAQAETIEPPLDSAAARALTARFHELRKQVQRQLVDAAAELGQILEEGRRVLRGSYERWLSERLGVEPSTARNYIALYQMARTSPGLLERHRELGAAKLYKLARLPPAGRDEVLRTPDLARMSDAEFHSVAARHVERKRKVTGNMRAHGLGEKVRAMTEALGQVTAPRGIDQERRVTLRRALQELARTARALADELK